MRTDQEIGSTNAKGKFPNDRAFDPIDLLAGVCRFLGIDPETTYPDYRRPADADSALRHAHRRIEPGRLGRTIRIGSFDYSRISLIHAQFAKFSCHRRRRQPDDDSSQRVVIGTTRRLLNINLPEPRDGKPGYGDGRPTVSRSQT